MQALTQPENKLIHRAEETLNLQTKIESMDREVHGIKAKINHINNMLPHVRSHLSSLKGTVERDHQTGRNPSPYTSAMTEKEHELNQLLKELDLLKNRMEEINNQKSEVESALNNLGMGAQADEVQSHLKRIDETRKQADKIRSLIHEQEQLLSSVSYDQDDKLEKLQIQREEVLADIAQGNDKQHELNSLDDEIASLVNDADGSHADAIKTHRHAKQTITGLKRRLAETEKKLDTLSGHTPYVLEQFLRGQIDIAGKQYLKFATRLIEEFKKVKVLSDLLVATNSDIADIVNPLHLRRMSLPAFAIPCFEGIENEDGFLFIGNSQSQIDAYNTIKQTELKRFKEMGLSDLFG